MGVATLGSAGVRVVSTIASRSWNFSERSTAKLPLSVVLPFSLMVVALRLRFRFEGATLATLTCGNTDDNVNAVWDQPW